MKKLAAFIIALTVALSLGGKVLADNTTTLVDNAGITADNIYKELEELRIKMATKESEKVEVLVDIAEERLKESELMAEKKEMNLLSEAVKEYEDKMTEAEHKVEEAILGATIINDNRKIKELSKLEEKIVDKQFDSIEVLKTIRKKTSGEVEETLSKVIEMQRRKRKATVAVAEARQALTKNKEAVKEAEEKLEEAKESGYDKKIKIAKDDLEEAKKELTVQCEKLTKVALEKKEAMKYKVDEQPK